MTTEVSNHEAALGDEEPGFFDAGDKIVDRLCAALDGSKAGRIDDWRADVLRELRAVLEGGSLPKPLTKEGAPGDVAETPMNSAIHYRIASELTRRYQLRRSPADAAALSRGLVLEYWDIWWRAAGYARPKEEESRLRERFPALEDGKGRIVEPSLIRDAISLCNRDVSFALTRDEPDADVEDKLLKQIDWQLRRLCLCQESFGEPDRAVLYELLRLHHVQYSHDVYGLPTDTAVRLVNDVKVFHDSIETFGKVKLPECSDEAFLSEEKDEAGQEEERRRIVDALLAIYGQSVQESDRNLKLVPKRITDTARKWRRLTREEVVDVDQCTGEEEFESVVRRMLLFWATRSRILRHALNDLLDFRFSVPERESLETKPPPTSTGELATGCDCWIAVIGHRRAGKTSFMNALTAALMPDESRFDELPVPEDFWSRSRAQLVMTSAFSRAKSRSDAIETSRDLGERLLYPWLTEVRQSPTTPAVRNMIEIDTAFLARIRFFDLAGEHMYDDEIGNPDEHVQKMIEDRRPVATIIVDDSDPARTKEEERRDNGRDGTEGPGTFFREGDRDKYLRLIHDHSAPIYIVVNKCDYFLENYEGDAKQEMRESLSYSHSETPARHDVEHGVPFIPFV